MQILVKNLNLIHTTPLGIERIQRNLKIKKDVVEYCKKKILQSNTIYKRGKNWYVEVDNIRITINSYSYTIITAHVIKKGK